MIIMVSSLVVIISSILSSLTRFWYLIESFFLFFSFMMVWVLVGRGCRIELVSSVFFLDSLGILLILLTFFITALMLRGRYRRVKFPKKMNSFFLYLRVVILVMLYLSFISLSPIYFYIFFEASLIPIFLLVIGWGYQPERLQAGVYMLFYTLFGSLPLLVLILNQKEFFSWIFHREVNIRPGVFSYLISFFLIFAFLVKLPMFGVHLWLPKAHVEAPVAGSIILAGVLLKLGSYGIWRFMEIVYSPLIDYRYVLIMVGLVGGLIVSFVCTIQVDMKALVAYSSVVHMGILLRGIITFFIYGYEGALCIILGHGLVSSGLFFLAGVIYDRLGTRSLLINKGLIILFPSLTVSWFMLSVYNIRAPPSLSLLREILLTSSVLYWRVITFLWLMIINFISMVYTFYLYSQSQQGKVFSSLLSVPTISRREYIVSILHFLGVRVLFLAFWFFYLNSLNKNMKLWFSWCFLALGNYQ